MIEKHAAHVHCFEFNRSADSLRRITHGRFFDIQVGEKWNTYDEKRETGKVTEIKECNKTSEKVWLREQ